MEDVLDVYQRPYDPKRPQVCLDETRKELHSTPQGTLPLQPGQPKREDYEYDRNGTASLFLWVQPLAGQRGVIVSERQTGYDLAEVLRHLSEEVYPQAEQIVLVCDNLKTHAATCLYERFAPEQAGRIARRFEWHYTPEHGSQPERRRRYAARWLNIAECELSVLTRQCLSRRLPDSETLKQEVDAWEAERNAQRVTIDWQFRAEDARIKLRRLYPVLKEQLST